jgi:hypothetical protein
MSRRPLVQASCKKLPGTLAVSAAHLEWTPAAGQSTAALVTIPIGHIRRKRPHNTRPSLGPSRSLAFSVD